MVVAAPDHPSRDLSHALSFQTGTAQDSVDDISATLTLMRVENTKPGGLFDGHIDQQHVAIVGHSAGGGTAEAAARQIDTIRRLRVAGVGDVQRRAAAQRFQRIDHHDVATAS